MTEAPIQAKRPRRKRPITAQGVKGKPSRVPPRLVDPAFLTTAELHRRELFAQAYVAHGSPSKAAAEAGFTGTRKVLQTTAEKLVREPHVALRIREIQRARIQELELTQAEVLAEYKRIAFFDLGACFGPDGELLPMHKIPEDARRALSSYRIKHMDMGEGGSMHEREVKAADKLAALNKLAIHLGLFKNDDGGKITADDFIKAMIEARDRLARDRPSPAEVASNGRTLEHRP